MTENPADRLRRVAAEMRRAQSRLDVLPAVASLLEVVADHQEADRAHWQEIDAARRVADAWEGQP